MSNRWVRIRTDLLEHRLFRDQVSSDKDAWLYLICNAAWADTSHRVGNNLHEVKRGSFFTTIRHLMKEWKWGNTKVVNFLSLLAQQDMIQVENKTRKTYITICNYSEYQDANDETRQEQDKYQDTNKTPTRHQQDTKGNNYNNYNKETTDTTREDLDDLEKQLLEAGGVALDQSRYQLHSLEIPLKWIENNWSLERDILPTIKFMSQRKEANEIHRWNYFSSAIADAYKTRIEPLTEGKSNGKQKFDKDAAIARVYRAAGIT